MQYFSYQAIDEISLIMKETYFGYTRLRKEYHQFMFLKIKDVIKEFLYYTKKKYNLSTQFLDEHFFGIQPSHVDLQIATMLYS